MLESMANATRIIVYTGKGGVGKTSVAAATALLCAERGKRTLVISTDIAHSLADSFDLPLGGEPTAIVENLWGQESDVYYNVRRYWGTIQRYVQSVFKWRGLDDVLAEELTVLPGMDELSSLLWIAEHHDSGKYDVIVVDAAPTGETVRLLSLPEALPSGPSIVASHTPPGLKSNACVVILLPAHGAHHSARWVALLNASKTSRRGPSMMRETTISRSASLSACLAICVLLLLKFLHVLVEPVEVLVPVLLEADDPLVHRLEAARVEAVEPLLAGLADPHESHFAKHAQVLRRARLRDPQCACKLIDRTL